MRKTIAFGLLMSLCLLADIRSAPAPFARRAPAPLTRSDFVGTWWMDWDGHALYSGILTLSEDGFLTLRDGRKDGNLYRGQWAFAGKTLSWDEKKVGSSLETIANPFERELTPVRKGGMLCRRHGWTLNREKCSRCGMDPCKLCDCGAGEPCSCAAKR